MKGDDTICDGDKAPDFNPEYDYCVYPESLGKVELVVHIEHAKVKKVSVNPWELVDKAIEKCIKLPGTKKQLMKLMQDVNLTIMILMEKEKEHDSN